MIKINNWTIGFKFQSGAWWLGVHYSNFYKRFCVNLIPWCTVWICKPGGEIPGYKWIK